MIPRKSPGVTEETTYATAGVRVKKKPLSGTSSILPIPPAMKLLILIDFNYFNNLLPSSSQPLSYRDA